MKLQPTQKQVAGQALFRAVMKKLKSANQLTLASFTLLYPSPAIRSLPTVTTPAPTFAAK